MSKHRVAIAGINGRMGRACIKLLHGHSKFEIAGALGRSDAPYIGKDAGTLVNLERTGVLVTGDIDAILSTGPDIWLDFTVAELSVLNARKALTAGVRAVIGTSGISDADVLDLAKLSNEGKIGALVVPNFSVGAVLMMEFARQAGAFFQNVEIVEMHHTGKRDAPSGTAMHTVRKLSANHKSFNAGKVEEHELLAGARGGLGHAGVRVHSLRLPGLISHQEVIFGGPGELLKIKHDSFNTDCFLQGIEMSLEAVMKLHSLVVGLDQIMGLAGEAGERSLQSALA